MARKESVFSVKAFRYLQTRATPFSPFRCAHILRLCALLLCSVTLSSCSQLAPSYRILNHASLSEPTNRQTMTPHEEPGENLVMLAFSGSGTRAAALSYGVLHALSETTFTDSKGRAQTLLEDVDYIASVSGGSFTAAYYAAFGPDIFKEYETALLRKTAGQVFYERWLDPAYWWHALVSGFDPTDMAITYYDKHVFKGKTFADIPSGRPYLSIGTSDLYSGEPVTFNQALFDSECLDPARLPLASVVSASAAMPVLYTGLALERGRDCHVMSRDLKQAAQKRSTVFRKADSGTNATEPDRGDAAYAFLFDGSISDPYGLHGLSAELDRRYDKAMNAGASVETWASVRRVVLVLVHSASVRPEDGSHRSLKPDTPNSMAALKALMSRQLGDKQKADFFDHLTELKLGLSERYPQLEFYLIQVGFDPIFGAAEAQALNGLPTEFGLSEAQINVVIDAGSEQLGHSSQFKALLRSLRKGE